MPDLMHEDVGDEVAQRLVVRRPIVEERAPVEPDHVGELPRAQARATLRQADAAEETEEVELALAVHDVERLVVREILDPDHHALAQTAEARGQARESL